MSIAVNSVGIFKGQPVREAVLTSDSGVNVSILSYGAIVRDWQIPVAGTKRSVVLGFEKFEPYLSDNIHLGAIVGRVANRIGLAQFQLNEKTYQLPMNIGRDHLHGGPEGLSKQNWQLTIDEKTNAVILQLHSPSGEMGYPGAVDFTVTYRLHQYRLTIEMKARVSELTPVSLVQHNYFNLMGDGTIYDHLLQVNASTYTVLSEALVTTGEVRSVHGTSFDFSRERNMKSSNGEPQAYDINLVFNPERNLKDPAAILSAPDRSLVLKLWTDQPAVQLYNGAERGVCLEDQMFPDAVNKPQFPSILVSPEKAYSHICEIEIKPNL